MKGYLWEGVYDRIQDVPVEGKGFGRDEWINKSLEKVATFRDLACVKDTVPSVMQNRDTLLPLVASMVYSVFGHTRILDFGGSVGFGYYQVLKALPDTKEFEYHVLELKEVCNIGREFFRKEPRIHFHSVMPEIDSGYIDVVQIGSSLQCIEEWTETLHQLCDYMPKYVLLSNIPAGDIPTFASAQAYYSSKMPCWFFNVHEIIEEFMKYKYKAIFKSKYITKIFGREQPYPMDSFEKKYQLDYPCNLLFCREGEK